MESIHRSNIFVKTQRPECKTGVYCIKNTINRKVYVGSTSCMTFRKRWRVHIMGLRRGRHHSPHLQAAWRKYGEDAFEFQILLECDPDDCLQLEQECIDSFMSADPRYGYNINPCAESSRGVIRSEEVRKRLSESIKRAHARPEVKALRAEIMNDPEFRTRRAELLKLLWTDPEYREKVSRGCKAAMARPEVKAKISAALKQRYESDPTFREKVAAASRGRKHTAETRAKMSVSGSTPEVRAKKSAANKGKPKSAETRAKMSAAQRNLGPETSARKAAGARAGWIKRKANLLAR